PYADKVRNIAAHMAQANPEYEHPYMVQRQATKAVGIILVTTDKGLCGALNTNVQRVVLSRLKELDADGVQVQTTAIGNKGLGFLTRVDSNIVSQAVQLGDKPNLERLIGAIKVQLDAYAEGTIDAVYLSYNRFINTMKQEAVLEQLLPLSADRFEQSESEKKAYSWDYIYEPDAKTVIDELLHRYVEALVYQAVAENMASEQSARMVAMKAASDNAKKVISDLQLVYNKTRQASITQEITEIVSGASAV